MLLLKIALRNIFRNKRRSLLNGVAMCVSFALVSISVGMNEGGYARIIEMFTGENVGHLQIHHKDYLEKPSLYKTIAEYSDIEKVLVEIENIKSYSPRIYSGALAFGSKKSIGTSLIGIDEKLERSNTKLLKKITKQEGSLKDGVYISSNLAKVLKVDTGGEIILLSQGADGSIANDIFTIVAILDTEGGTLGNNVVILSKEKIWDFLSLWGRIHEVVITAESFKIAGEISKRLEPLISDKNSVEPWYIVKKDFYKAMMMDKNGGYVFLVIIMIVAAIGVLNAVLMSVFERMKEYGLLKAIGTTPLQIFSLILYENLFLTALSIIPGLVLAFISNYFLSEYGVAMDPPMKYGGITFDSMKSVINLQIFIWPLVIIGMTSVIVSIIPAIMAARVVPNKVMRVVG